MERAEWLKQMRGKAEALYDHLSPDYWVQFGADIDKIHYEYLQKFLGLAGQHGSSGRTAGQPGVILSAACGAGRFDGLLMEAGYSVVGIDQSAGMLARAREHFPPELFPQVRYEKMGLQELALDLANQAAFDGAICMDAMEHIPPEDWPGILRGFHTVLKPGGPLYITADVRDAAEIRASYEHALAMGLPVVYGEIADEVDEAARRVMEGGEVVDQCVYHYSPPLEQIHDWLRQAGLTIVEEGAAIDYQHIIAMKPFDSSDTRAENFIGGD